MANTLPLRPFADLGPWQLPEPAGLAMQLVFVVAGVVACAIATALSLTRSSAPGRATD